MTNNVIEPESESANEDIDTPEGNLEPSDDDTGIDEGADADAELGEADDVADADAGDQLRAGYIRDYISGRQVRATPEEIQAVQVFSQRLVEDFGYPVEVITTRPQFRVRARPSEERARSYPVDIAVFAAERKLEDDTFILVECKRKTRHDGERQLKLYLSMSSARIGVWFNGEDHLYLYKKYMPDGTIEFSPLPTIPKFGQTIDDIGLLRRRELTVPVNLKAHFRDIRNHLAGNTVGISRDQALAEQIMSLLFCKIYDELNTPPDDLPRFRTAVDEPADRVRARIDDLFQHVKDEYPDVFQAHEVISLDADSLRYVVGELQNFAITESTRDAIGDAFEVFIGPAVRGEEGQFFTPRNVVQMLVHLLDPRPGETVIDPACGSGGFLVVALEHIWRQLEEQGAANGWSPAVLERRKRDVASRSMRGMDKDGFLTKVTKAYMAIIGDGRGGIFCEDSLNQPANWSAMTQGQIRHGTFDVVLTNPPFGSKIKVTGQQKLSQYTLAKRWRIPRGGDWVEEQGFRNDQTPQILFIERCIQLLKPGGRLGIVLPESIFGMSNYGYVQKYLLERYKLRAFISLPEEIFQPYTHAKTCVVILQNSPPDDEPIQMAIADWCGHDSRGNPTVRREADGTEVLLDDLPTIAEHMAPHLQWVPAPRRR
ncbi:restriction endonuclease subunit M [Arenibaculum sp.]|uniref:restriction endonuclease subunit M n=1 Tax=Arenibaculum sp. TaxID=2865862 RepID=UPI002E0E435F|nr:N-6 DNA methylase [Arenibaculum sp.]